MEHIHIRLQAGYWTHPFKSIVSINGRSTFHTRRRCVSRVACAEKKAEGNDEGRKTSATLNSLARLLGKDEVEDVTPRNPAGMWL